jgi:hypothetical protein
VLDQLHVVYHRVIAAGALDSNGEVNPMVVRALDVKADLGGASASSSGNATLNNCADAINATLQERETASLCVDLEALAHAMRTIWGGLGKLTTAFDTYSDLKLHTYMDTEVCLLRAHDDVLAPAALGVAQHTRDVVASSDTHPFVDNGATVRLRLDEYDRITHRDRITVQQVLQMQRSGAW